MAEYLIQDTTLDDIADAINAKTGGSSAMTPAQMVTAIGTILGSGDNLKTAMVTLAQDYTGFSTTALTLFSAAIGTGSFAWQLIDAAGYTFVTEDGILVKGAHLGTLDADAPNEAKANVNLFTRHYRGTEVQSFVATTTNTNAKNGMVYKIWGWDT